MSTRKAGKESFWTGFPHTPPSDPQLPSSKLFVFCSSREPRLYVPWEWEEIRGLRNREGDLLELSWCYTHLSSAIQTTLWSTYSL